MKTVVILSGGMDSTTLLYKCIAEGKEVSAISFNYGQRHSKELDMAKATCEKLGISHKIVDITSITDLISNSALTNYEQEVPEGHYAEDNMKATVVPNRNMIMASIAIGYAVNIGAQELALGIHAGDHAVYPDCRPEFLNALNHIAQIANFEPVSIYAPYTSELTKADICIEGLRLGVDFGLTWTCYKGLDKPCGKCGSCVERIDAFNEASKVFGERIYDAAYTNAGVTNEEYDVIREDALKVLADGPQS